MVKVPLHPLQGLSQEDLYVIASEFADGGYGDFERCLEVLRETGGSKEKARDILLNI
jgi:hypothetical protein